MARKPKTTGTTASAVDAKPRRAAARTKKPALASMTAQQVHVPANMSDTAKLHNDYMTAVDSIRSNAEMMAQAEFRAVNDMYDVLTARANVHGLPPTQIKKVGNAYMICYLQPDGSYGRCRPYTGEV